MERVLLLPPKNFKALPFIGLDVIGGIEFFKVNPESRLKVHTNPI